MVCVDFAPVTSGGPAINGHANNASHIDEKSALSSWRDVANGVLNNATKVNGLGRKGPISADIYANTSWQYFWKTTESSKLMFVSNINNIFQKKNITLPTYSSYVWKWSGDDDTDIYEPSAYL